MSIYLRIYALYDKLDAQLSFLSEVEDKKAAHFLFSLGSEGKAWGKSFSVIFSIAI